MNHDTIHNAKFRLSSHLAIAISPIGICSHHYLEHHNRYCNSIGNLASKVKRSVIVQIHVVDPDLSRQYI